MSYSYHLTLQEEGMSHEAFLDKAVAFGLRAVEWCHGPFHAPEVFDEASAHEARRLSDERGLQSYLSGFAPILAEGERVGRMLDMLEVQLRTTEIFGAPVMRFDGMINQERRVNAPKPIDLCVANLERVVKRAAEAGVVIALENHMDFTIADLKTILERIDSPNLQLTFDVGNSIPRLEHPLDFARELLPHIVNVHFKSVEFLFEDYGATLTSVPVEQSAIDLTELVGVLATARRDVTLQIEVVARKREDEDRLVDDLARFVNSSIGG